ncbi:relaxase/mobilization nuclease (plasmid) [Cylindrospermum stagnale PCC 7417]|uniref:Relaxase/mobilization nuclease n=1 Tax=Cylindrospermum stagnale PCC 7417 TaxID=56107 RepID=K9X7B2_9NOST|nr:relaxase/mobilization nuclease domain-containing protein [Cylindrospermum stagnale]AFZ28510.1 relaxase/mobilization nuclease [Cylindrospermum stagnale PCC 7417]
MIGKQFKNQSFRSTLDYVLGKDKATMIDSNMGGTTPRQLAKEFGAARRLRPNLQRACAHVILSIPHRDASHEKGMYHEHLEDEQYTEIAQHWLKAMKFLGEELNQSQYVVARHHDTNHEHIHIIASRIRMDGSVVPDSWDYRRSEVVVRQLEKEFGLEAVSCSSERVATKVKEECGIETAVSEHHAQTQKQRHHSSSKPPVTQLLADIIDEATKDQPTVTQFIKRLQQQSVVVHPQFSTQGLFKKAIAFEIDGVKVAGYKLGSAYSFPGLQKKRGVSYDPERDLPAICSCAAGELVELLPPAMEQLMAVSPPGEEMPVGITSDGAFQTIATVSGVMGYAPLDAIASGTALRAIAPEGMAHQMVTEEQHHISTISPIIRLFWQKVARPETYSGKYYDLQLEKDILKLKRKSGEEIAEITLDPSAESQDKGLTNEDLTRMEKLKALLLTQSRQQMHQNQVDMD